MKLTVKPYLRQARIALQQIHEYKFNWILLLLKTPVTLVLFWFVWSTLFHYQGTQMSGYRFEDMMLYLLSAQWIAFVLSRPVSTEMERDLRTGKLSQYLCRPIHYLPSQLASFFAQSFLNLLVSLLPFSIVLYALEPATFSWIKLFGFLCALFTSLLIFFLLESCLGCCAFWFNRIFGITHLANTVFNIAGGKLIPLALLPVWFKKIAFLSPLQAIYAKPISIFQQGSWRDIFLTQMTWIVVLAVILSILWSCGKKRYEANG